MAEEKFPAGRAKFLWAPWRSEYITSKKKGGCLFCSKVRARNPARAGVLFRGERAFVLLNAYPYTGGHLMVAPRRHIAELEDLSEEEIRELLALAQKSVSVLKAEMKPDGFNVGFNLGRPAGAGVVDHLHVHVVPRWNGDTSFMPVFGGARVVSQSLDEVYRLLKPRFGQIPRR